MDNTTVIDDGPIIDPGPRHDDFFDQDSVRDDKGARKNPGRRKARSQELVKPKEPKQQKSFIRRKLSAGLARARSEIWSLVKRNKVKAIIGTAIAVPAGSIVAFTQGHKVYEHELTANRSFLADCNNPIHPGMDPAAAAKLDGQARLAGSNVRANGSDITTNKIPVQPNPAPAVPNTPGTDQAEINAETRPGFRVLVGEISDMKTMGAGTELTLTNVEHWSGGKTVVQQLPFVGLSTKLCTPDHFSKVLNPVYLQEFPLAVGSKIVAFIDPNGRAAHIGLVGRDTAQHLQFPASSALSQYNQKNKDDLGLTLPALHDAVKSAIAAGKKQATPTTQKKASAGFTYDMASKSLSGPNLR